MSPPVDPSGFTPYPAVAVQISTATATATENRNTKPQQLGFFNFFVIYLVCSHVFLLIKIIVFLLFSYWPLSQINVQF